MTLRAWDRRYGLMRPHRTPKGHRLYTAEHIEQVHEVLRLVEEGVPISRINEALSLYPVDVVTRRLLVSLLYTLG